MDQWRTLLEAAASPGAAATRVVSAGKQVVGVQCPLAPVELIHAFGLTPWRITIPPGCPSQSGHLLQTFCCTWIQALLDQALAGHLSHLWGVILSCSPCDSMRNLPDIWCRSVDAPDPEGLFALKLPARREGGAEELLKVELEGLRRWLERRSGQALDPTRLEASAALFNRIRAALRGLERLTASQTLPASTLLQATLGAQLLEPAESADLLEQMLERSSDASPDPPEPCVRLMLVTGPLDDARILQWLESRGASGVAFDSCALNLFYDEAADLDPHAPLEDLARRHLRRPPCATSAGSAGLRRRRLGETLSGRGVQGVVFVRPRGCDPHAFDNALLAPELDRLTMPHLSLEVDPQGGSWSQLTNRLDAFLELVRGRPRARTP